VWLCPAFGVAVEAGFGVAVDDDDGLGEVDGFGCFDGFGVAGGDGLPIFGGFTNGPVTVTRVP